jgi:putative phosphoesterase
MRVGLISDTHGLLRPEALAALRGCDLLLHAGDVGDPAVLTALAQVAPLHAVRGNVDRWPGAEALPDHLDLELGAVRVHLLHDHATLPPNTAADVVVCGHSHRPGVERIDGRLVVNPGSAGPRRFSLPVSVGFLDLSGGTPHARCQRLEVPPARVRR